MMKSLWIVSLVLLLCVACQPNSSTVVLAPTEEPVSIVKRVATAAPSATPSQEDMMAAQTLIALQPSPAPPTLTPTQPPYIGVFLGEASFDPFAPITSLNPIGAVAELPTASPLGIRLICDIPEDAIFGADWRENQRVRGELRCPIQIMFGFGGRIQIFEGGVMYHRPETNEVWAISPGRGGNTGAYWYLGQVPDVGDAVIGNAPSGRVAPTGVFASMWLTIPEVRDTLGYAVQSPFNGNINVQRFDGGTLFLDGNAGQVFALLLNGDAAGPYAGDIPLP